LKILLPSVVWPSKNGNLLPTATAAFLSVTAVGKTFREAAACHRKIEIFLFVFGIFIQPNTFVGKAERKDKTADA
jgi:hypothetical protein